MPALPDCCSHGGRIGALHYLRGPTGSGDRARPAGGPPAAPHPCRRHHHPPVTLAIAARVPAVSFRLSPYCPPGRFETQGPIALVGDPEAALLNADTCRQAGTSLIWDLRPRR